jgi:hypothetical protein
MSPERPSPVEQIKDDRAIQVFRKLKLAIRARAGDRAGFLLGCRFFLDAGFFRIERGSEPGWLAAMTTVLCFCIVLSIGSTWTAPLR